jgi:hypothetical protein
MTPSEAKAVAAQAGFSGDALNTIVAIGTAESGLNPTARNTNTNGSTDRGWLQINSIHAQVSDAMADDPVQAAQFAYQLSKGGTDFSAWTTFTSGRYRQFLPAAQAADVGAVPGSVSSSTPAAAGDGTSSDPCPGFLTLNPATIAKALTCQVGKMFDQLATDLAHAALSAVFVAGALALIVIGVAKATDSHPLAKVRQAATVAAIA